jgi:hypothetical protein
MLAYSVHISFGGNDAAFTDDWASESVRILRELADKIEQGRIQPGDSGKLLDSNGNTIGSYHVSK